MKQHCKTVGNAWRASAALVCALLTVFFLFAPQKAAATETDAQKTVKIGYINCGHYIERLENGTFAGYGVEYLEKLSEYTGWEYEYVYGTWAECLARLDSGEIDLLPMTEYTQERAAQYLYSKYPQGYEYPVLYVSSESRLYYEEYSAMNGYRVGTLKGSFYDELLNDIQSGYDITLIHTYHDTMEELAQALSSGELDAVILGSAFVFEGGRLIGKFDAQPFYSIANANNTALMKELDRAHTQIKVDYPRFESDLIQAYFSDPAFSAIPLFTREEQAFIDSAEPIPVKMMLDTRPLSYMADGTPTGIFISYFDLLSEKTGLQFRFESSSATTLNRDTLNIPNTPSLTLRSRQVLRALSTDSGLLVSDPLIDSNLAYVKRQDALFDPSQALTFAATQEMSYLPDLLYADNPDHTLISYSTVEECMGAVVDGVADIAIQDEFLIRYWMQKPKYSDTLVQCTGDNVDVSLCVVASQDNALLIQILNKAIDVISRTERESLASRELIEHPYRTTLPDILYQHGEWIALVTLLLLISAVGYFIMTRRMAQLHIQKREFEILQKKVQFDMLTGLYSASYFQETVADLLATTEHEMCIVMLNVANFKIVNDFYGVEQGDRLLQYIAKLLRDWTSGLPVVLSRFNADHFYICMKRKDFDNVHFPKRIKYEPMAKVDISLTYGVFVINDQLHLPVNIMCDRAAMALHNTPNRHSYIFYYTGEERSTLIREQIIESEMEDALKNHHFCLHVQPKYDIRTSRIIGGEALVRWLHPQKGLIPPADFIPIFEKNGFILDLDYYVWEEACKLLCRMREQGLDYPLSVNVSRAHFYTNNLYEILTALVEKYDLPPEKLELEVTESIYVDNTNLLYKQIVKLQNAGFKIAMDDFGSAYSSLNVLKELPLNILKMDLKFLDSTENVEKSHKILHTLVNLAHNLDLSVVVEGVETKEQTEFLQQIGDLSAQGYYYSRPVGCDAYINMLL